MSGFSVTRRQALALSTGGLATLATPAWARHALLDDGLAAKADAVVAAFMEKFETPGIGDQTDPMKKPYN